MKLLPALCLTAGFVLFSANAATANAPSPEEIAAGCVAKVRHTVERCTNATATETQQCVATIRRLIAGGHEAAARRVAHACIASLTNRTENCVARVKGICERCIEFLLDIGEPRLAHRVAGVCHDAVDKLRSNLQRAKGAIRRALGS